MKNYLISICMIAAILSTSCTKQEFTINSRTPEKTPFVQRILPAGFVVGQKAGNVQAVDLGLSVKWSDLYLDAENDSTASKALYAWAEISSKKEFTWGSYEHNDSKAQASSWDNALFLTKYCFDKYGTKQDIDKAVVLNEKEEYMLDDAAYIAYGDGYRMPTVAEVEELVSECTWKYVEVKVKDEQGKEHKYYYYVVTGENGNFIKIATDSSKSVEMWTANQTDGTSPYAYSYIINHKEETDKSVTYLTKRPSERCIGKQIRAVYTK